MNRKSKYCVYSCVCFFALFLLLSSNTLVACSGFVVKNEQNVLVGHNKDWWNPETTVYVYPSEADVHGRIFFEIPFPHPFNSDYRVLAGGMNDQGLCFESFVTPFNLASFELFKPPLFKNPVDQLMQEYSTVEEVVEFIESHNLFFLNYILAFGQIFVADQTGDAVIIEGDELIRMSGDYQICTNFLQSDPGLGNYPCWRYEYLTTAFENDTTLSIPYFRSLLEYVQIYPQYSWIFNPNNLSLYVYHFHDFDHAFHFDLNQEFNKDAYSFELASLFEPSENTAPEKPETPTGPSNAATKQTIVFTTNTTDQQNDPSEIYYKWDFGDNTETSWTYNYQAYRGTISHQYKKSGNYQVKVKAKDIYGKESLWSDPLEIRISRYQLSFHPIIDFIKNNAISTIH
jgi:hypothetical protein